jgi:cysteine synthase
LDQTISRVKRLRLCFRSTAASRRIEAEAALIAVVTGASSGIGFELAKYAAQKDYDLIVAADEPQIEAVSDKLRAEGAEVIAVKVDLGRASVGSPTVTLQTAPPRTAWDRRTASRRS